MALSDKIIVSQAATELGVSGTTLHRWINEYKKQRESAFPGKGNVLLNSDYEIKKLQKANDELRMENDLLKNSRSS